MIMGLPVSGSYMARETGYVLGEISENEVRANRPMLSAVAIGVKGRPGPGFFSFAKQLDLLDETKNELDFWQEQREAVYRAWRRPLPKSKPLQEKP